MSIEHGDESKKYLASDEPVSGGSAIESEEAISEEEAKKQIEFIKFHNGEECVELSEDENYDKFIIGILLYKIADNKQGIEYHSTVDGSERFIDNLRKQIEMIWEDMDIWFRLAKHEPLIEAYMKTNKNARYNYSHFAGSNVNMYKTFIENDKPSGSTEVDSVEGGFNLELSRKENDSLDRANSEDGRERVKQNFLRRKELAKENLVKIREILKEK